MAAALGFAGGMFGFGGAAAFTVAGGAAFGGWVAGAAFGTTLLGGLTAKLLTTVALGALSRAMTKEPEQGGGITISTTLSGEQNPETITLGRYGTGGQAICPPYSHGSSSRYLTHIIELCSAPGAQLDRIMIGDDWAELHENEISEYGRPVLGDKYGGHIWVKYYNGTQTAPDPMLRSKYGSHPERPWTAKAIGRGLCYAILTFYYDQEKLPQVPRYRFELIGIPVYDFRKDSSAGGVGPQRLDDPSTWTVSHNPIVLAWNVMRGLALPGGDVWGGNISDLRALPRAVWLAAMNASDVPAEGEGGPEPMYRAGLEVALTSEPAAALTELLKAAAATIADLGWAWGVTAGAPALPVYSITDPDILVSAPEEYDPFPALADSWTAVTATYPDPGRYWETRESPQRIDLAREARATFGRRMAALSLPAVPYGAQVQRLTDAWLKDEARDGRHTITLPPDAAHVELIDTIAWTSEHNGYGASTFSIQEIVEDPFTGIRQMSIRVVDSTDYATPPDYLLPSPPGPPAPAPIMLTVDGFDVQPITMVDAASRARRAGIRISWSPALAGRGMRWRLRFASQTEIALQGTTQDLSAGFVDVFAGVLPVTDYEAQAELIADRRTVPSAWQPVTTDDVRLSQADLDAEVRDLLSGLDAWLDAAPPEWIGSVEDRFSELDVAVDELAGLAASNLNLARTYTDTSVEAEQIARVAGQEALAAQVQTLTAVLNSDNYLQNPRFVDGTDGWTVVTGAMTAMDRDELSSDPIIATAPTPKFVIRSVPGMGAHAIQQIFDVEWEPGEVFQWRIWLTAEELVPVQVRLFWLDADGVQVGAKVTPVTIAPGAWKVFSGREPPPEGATQLRFNTLRGSTSGTTGATAQLAIADASVTKVDEAQQAQITSLQVAFTNHETTQTLWQLSTESRMGDAEAATASEILTRASADSALSGRIDSTESRLTTVEGGKLDASAITSYYTKIQTDDVAAGAASAATTALKAALEGPGGSINALATAVDDLTAGVTDLGEAYAGLHSLVEASGGMVDLVRDGVFALGAARWPTSNLPLSLFERNLASSTWQYRLIPASRAWRVTPDDGASNRYKGTGRFPVTPGEEVRLSFDAARWSASCVGIRVGIRYFDTAGAQLSGKSYQIDAGVVANRYRSCAGRTIVPDDAADAEVYFQAFGAGATANAFITNISALRGQQAYASGDLKVTAEVAPTGAVTRVGLRARAEGEAVGEASLYLEAGSDGTSRALLNAREAYIFDGALQKTVFAARDGNIYAANALVDTLSIKGNSVIVPATQTLANTLTGNGGWINVSSASITLPQTGTAHITWAGSQSYAVAQNQAIGIRLRVDGTVVWERVTGDPPGSSGLMTDWLSMAWSRALAAGAHTIAVDWWGGNANLRLHTRTLTIFGAMR